MGVFTILLESPPFMQFLQTLKTKTKHRNNLWVTLTPNKNLFCFSFFYNMLAYRRLAGVGMEHTGFHFCFPALCAPYVGNDQDVLVL